VDLAVEAAVDTHHSYLVGSLAVVVDNFHNLQRKMEEDSCSLGSLGEEAEGSLTVASLHMVEVEVRCNFVREAVLDS
jgi:hypothetical protein